MNCSSFENTRRAEKATGFYSTKKVRGSETRSSVLNRLGLTGPKPVSKIVVVNGIPCKMVDGVAVELKRVSK
jgi:hypothetical protein